MKTDIQRTLTDIDQADQIGQKSKVIFTSFVRIDSSTGGFEPGSVVVLGGQPGIGKTSLAVNIVATLAPDYGTHCLYITLQQPSLSIANKMIAFTSNVPYDKLRRGRLREDEYQQLYAKTHRLSEAPIVIDDQVSTLDSVVKSIESFATTHDSSEKLVVLDDIHHVLVDKPDQDDRTVHFDTRDHEITRVMRQLKHLSIKHQLVTLGISQLRRSSYDQVPTLKDLRDSGSIENFADVVLLLYPIKAGEFGYQESHRSAKQSHLLSVDKNRSKEQSITSLSFTPSTGKFDDSHEYNERFTGVPPSPTGIDDDPGIITFASKANDSQNENENPFGEDENGPF